jgi:hypothetical protein
MNNNVPEVVTNYPSNTFQIFQLPQGFAIQNINNSNISSCVSMNSELID